MTLRRLLLTEAGEDESPRDDDERLEGVGVHESREATWSHTNTLSHPSIFYSCFLLHSGLQGSAGAYDSCQRTHSDTRRTS